MSGDIIISTIGKVVVGFVIGFILTVVLVHGPFRPTRERNIYQQGVEEGIKGKFRIEIDTVMYHIVPTEKSEN